MAQDTETFNNELYDLLKVRGYKPVPLNSQNQRVGASQQADVIEFTFTKDGEDYGKAWISVDDASNLKVYFDNDQQDSPDTKTPGVDYDDTWTGLLKHLKSWAQRRQLSFELSNKDRLGDDMRQRDYYKMKEKLGESKSVNEVSTDTEDSYYMKAVPQKTAAALTRQSHRFKDLPKDIQDRVNQTFDKRKRGTDRFVKKHHDELTKPMDQQRSALQVKESYHPMGKKASYNDAVPSVKIILQHNRALEEGEQRYRNVARIFLENEEGERFLAPTTRPGVARVYARHIAEGGLPNDERWNHIKTVIEDYNKMAGFVRATRNGEFNESALELVNEGVNHYNNLRETLKKMSGHRGYHAYFESWTPTLMEGEDEDLSEMFMSMSLDPRIESAMPILSRLKKPVTEMEEVSDLAEWADDIISEKLEMDSTTKSMAVPADKMLEAPGAETLAHNQSTEKKNLKAFGLAEEAEDRPIGKGKNAYTVTTPDGKKVTVLADHDWQAKATAKDYWKLPSEAGIMVKQKQAAPTSPASTSTASSNTAISAATAKANDTETSQKQQNEPTSTWQRVKQAVVKNWNVPGGTDSYGGAAKAIAGMFEGDVIKFPKGWVDASDEGEDEDDDLSWIPSEEEFEREEELRNRKPKASNDVDENFIGMAPQAVAEDEFAGNYKTGPAGQWRNKGPKKDKPAKVGDLVGASESTEVDPELARIMEIAGIKSK